jgi:hypothetical protein
MVALRHAALHAQGQKIIWQQVVIEDKEYDSRFLMSNPAFCKK